MFNSIVKAENGKLINGKPVSKAVGKVFPELNGKLTNMTFHISTPNVDLACHLEKAVKHDDVKKMVKTSEGPQKFILGYTDNQVVSCKFSIYMPLHIYLVQILEDEIKQYFFC